MQKLVKKTEGILGVKNALHFHIFQCYIAQIQLDQTRTLEKSGK
jgi:hypothetical protein